jgi:acyl-CoA reductase-like NAD-dependent aldehyde dehydrogenase
VPVVASQVFSPAFIAPTIVTEVDDDAAVVREEQFGPVLPILAYDSNAVDRANASSYGLGATVWGPDQELAFRRRDRYADLRASRQDHPVRFHN